MSSRLKQCAHLLKTGRGRIGSNFGLDACFRTKTNVARSDPFRMDAIPLPVSTGEKGTTNP